MMGQQTRNESLFYYFRLEEQIPEDHLLRLIDRYIDLSFIRERLKRFYSWTGRPSILPATPAECLGLHGVRLLATGDQLLTTTAALRRFLSWRRQTARRELPLPS